MNLDYEQLQIAKAPHKGLRAASLTSSVGAVLALIAAMMAWKLARRDRLETALWLISLSLGI